MTINRQELIDFIGSELLMGAMPHLSKQASNDSELLGLLWAFVKQREPKLSWRAAWIIDHATEDKPELLDPFLSEIYKELETTGDEFDGTVRHLLKFVLRRPLLEEQGGYLIDKCMHWLMSNNVPSAIRANSADYLYEIYVLMPDFKNEFLSAIDTNMEKGCSPGLLNKLTKIRKLLGA